ncbi:hypothetical protein PIB30_020514 [Stylosanthes scabra]|uniref:PB1-like domain-containing protein n=1 Tax=Stylosanthes scabra TaxID=79078 RepID=A0ABU6X6H0_9FABA|nr:hypothetical protein [Stylosanthes scabra]
MLLHYVYINNVNEFKGYFGYVDGVLRYVGGEKLTIRDNDSDFWCVYEAEEQLSRFGYPKSDIYAMWYKDPTVDDLAGELVQFIGDRDALEMVRIARERGSVELYVVHESQNNDEGFPEIGYIDVGGDGGGDEVVAGDEAVNAGGDGEGGQNGENEGVVAADNAEGGVDVEVGVAEDASAPNDGVEAVVAEEASAPNAGNVGAGLGESLNEVKNEKAMDGLNGVEQDDHSEGTTEHEEYVPSDVPSESAEDLHFTDSEEDFDLGDEFFRNDLGAGSSGVGNRGKRVANDEFSDGGDESEELENGHAIGGGGDNSDDDGRKVFPVHKEVPKMANYLRQVGTVYASREEFKDAIASHAVCTQRGITFHKCDRKLVLLNGPST